MKICVLLPEDEPNSNYHLSGLTAVKNPAMYDKSNLHIYETVKVTRSNSVQKILEFEKHKTYDVYLNLCEGDWYEDVAGSELVDILHQLNLAYTGSDPYFYRISKQAMKIAAYTAGLDMPNHTFIYDQSDLDNLLMTSSHDDQQTLSGTTEPDFPFNFPCIVKHHNCHDSMGMTKNSKVHNKQELKKEAERFLKTYDGCLIEEFIEGPEYTVLAVANHKDPENPFILTPIECKFPKNETFKHFGLKWLDHDQLRWSSIDDQKLIDRLKSATKLMMTSLQVTCYARCDFRYETQTDKLYFLEINSACAIFYEPKFWGSADFILSIDKFFNHQKFLHLIFETALAKCQKRRPTFKMSFDPVKRQFSARAKENLATGQIIQRNEENGQFLVSRRHVTQNWPAWKKEWLSKFAYPISSDLYSVWGPNPNEWSFFGHSDQPNAKFDGLNLIALKKIDKNSEITINSGDRYS